MQWKQTYFQAVATYIQNYRVDRMMVNPSHNIIILVENKFSDQDTIIHVYNYKHINKETGGDKCFEMKRKQILSTTLDLNTSRILLFNEYSRNDLSLIFCDENLLDSIRKNRCECFIWKSGSVGNIPSFHRTEKCQILNSLSSGRPESNNFEHQSNSHSISQDIFFFLSNVMW